MSSIVLLNSEGKVQTKVQFVVVPDDFVIPNGMTLSWKTTTQVSAAVNRLGNIVHSPEDAFFNYGQAQGSIKKKTRVEKGENGESYGVIPLEMTVQGTTAGDVMKLRNLLLTLIHERRSWAVENDLNEKPLLKQKLGLRLIRRLM